MDTPDVLEWLERTGTKATVSGMARVGIHAKHAVGVPMGTLLAMSRRLGTNHALALELWDSGCYEARLLATLVDDPARVTRTQMDTWAKSFENWADCDTACFKLFDRTPFAWAKARQWAASSRELVKRGGFVLMACLALHDKSSADEPFRVFLQAIEERADDERPLVQKGISWALRAIGERNAGLNAAAVGVAKRLAASDDDAPRWVGKDAVRQLASPKVRARLARRGRLDHVAAERSVRGT